MITAIAIMLGAIAGHHIEEALWFEATAQKESSNNPNVAAGDNGRSRGMYQIGRDFWIDGCEGAGVQIPYETGVQDPATCRIIIRGYWRKYRARSWEDRSRLHNGGPTRAGTDAYWIDIKDRMERIRRTYE